MRRLWLALLVMLLAGGALNSWNHRAVAQSPGVTAPDAPLQVDVNDGATLQSGDFVLRTRARFELTARVLSRSDYSLDAGASLSPTDLALGWGRMSDSAVLSKIEISQSGRFFRWHVKSFPIPRQEMESSAGNMHLIPANASVLAAIKQVRAGQIVHLQGFLVDARRDDGWHWNTSMTREDTGAGACELIYVERLTGAARQAEVAVAPAESVGEPRKT